MAMRYQPQGLLRIERGGLASNLRVAMLPGVNRALNVATQRALSAVGVNQWGSTSGLAAGFGATYGTGTAVDKIVTDVLGAFPAIGRSYFFRAMRNGAGGGSLGRLFDKTNGSTGQFLYWYAGGTSLGYGFFAGGSERYVGIPVAAQNIGEWFDVWVSHAFDGSTHTVNAWVNGAQVVTNFTLAASNTDAATTPFTIGNRNSDNIRSWDGLIESAHMWDGILPAAAPMLRANRYQLFVDPYESDDVSIAAAVVNDTSLTGAAVAQASGSGALVTSIKLSGSAQAVAAGAGALSTSLRLAGSATAVAAGAGALSTSIPLQGAAVAQAGASGALATGIALTGAAQAIASCNPPPILTNADAQFGAALTGSAVATASGSGQLSTAITLSGAATAVAASLASLTTRISLSGIAVSAASAAGMLADGGTQAPGGTTIDVSQISMDRIVIFEGSGSRVVVFEGSGSRVVIFEGSGTRVRFDQMSAKVPVKVGDKWTTDRDPDEISYYAADVTQELLDRNTTADPAKIVAVLSGVELLEGPELQVASIDGVERTFVVVKLGGVGESPPADWRWVARVTCLNGERFDKTTWFNKVDP